MKKINWKYHLLIFFALLFSSLIFFLRPETNLKKNEEILQAEKIEQTENKPEEKKTIIEKSKVTINKTSPTIKKNNEKIVATNTSTSTKETEKIVLELPYFADFKVNDKNYRINFSEENIILEKLMQQLQNENKSEFIFQTKDYGSMGKFVTEINNLKNDNEKGLYWIYYLNGKSANIGISYQKVNSGDNIEWKYEKSKF
ncbi:MAG: DUF4430 domain-containing protein [Candidatus Magasanikbacteria bacterium]